MLRCDMGFSSHAETEMPQAQKRLKSKVETTQAALVAERTAHSQAIQNRNAIIAEAPCPMPDRTQAAPAGYDGLPISAKSPRRRHIRS